MVMFAIRLFLSLFLLSGLAVGQGRYQHLEFADFVKQPETFEGRMVEVTAKVVAINANGQSLRLFDSQSMTLINVSLSRLQEAQRRALLVQPVLKLTVYGRAEVLNGRLAIDAVRVEEHLADTAVSTPESPSCEDSEEQ
jgi:hypothetical protein